MVNAVHLPKQLQNLQYKSVKNSKKKKGNPARQVIELGWSLDRVGSNMNFKPNQHLDNTRDGLGRRQHTIQDGTGGFFWSGFGGGGFRMGIVVNPSSSSLRTNPKSGGATYWKLLVQCQPFEVGCDNMEFESSLFLKKTRF